MVTGTQVRIPIKTFAAFGVLGIEAYLVILLGEAARYVFVILTLKFAM